jgi:ParB family chromosome partitioning protein
VAKKALGKGLGALLTDIDTEEKDVIKEIKITEIEPNKSQPRKNFDADKLEKLAESIKTHGVIQPIIVKKMDLGFYQIVAGERRWRAARLAGLKEIPVIIKDYEKREIIEIALIENLQRQDLNPIEESEAYQNLIDEFHLTQEEISTRVGKSRSAIANSLRLLNLSEPLKQLLIEEKISSGHARAILALDDKELQWQVAEEVVNKGLSVRETEKYVKDLVSGKFQRKVQKQVNELSPIYKDIQNKLSQRLGTKVAIHPGKTKSKIEIEYYSDEDLERLMKILNF